MATVGGSIETLGMEGREFAVATDADSARKLGGIENEVLANGNGSARLIRLRIPLSLDGLAIEIDDFRGDQEFVTELANRPDFFALDITYASGAIYQATVQIVGEYPYSSQSATMAIAFMGPAFLTRQN